MPYESSAAWLAQLRESIPEIAPEALDASHQVVDVRDADEVASGVIPGSVHLPRAFLELRADRLLPDRARTVVTVCASGARSLFAAAALRQLGYDEARSLRGGIDAYKAAGLPLVPPDSLGAEDRRRYEKHLLLREVGEEGQRKLRDARVLIVGAGGLGSPALLYLAAAGVGALGLVDADRVELGNLQRQVAHDTGAVGRAKVDSAAERIAALNPGVRVEAIRERLDADNARAVFGRGWSVVIDAVDNFAARYVINDHAVATQTPFVHASVDRFEGELLTYSPGRGACYRCLHPSPPPRGLAPSCAEAGVLGVVPGTLGVLQATEALKLVLGIGEPAFGRLVLFDALTLSVRSVRVPRDPSCTACGRS